MRDDPLKATYLGDRRYERGWPDLSPAAIQQRYTSNLERSARLAGIDRAALSTQDQLSYDLFAFEFRNRVLAYDYKPYLYELRPREGVQTASEQAELLPFATVADYDNWIAKLKALDRYVDQWRALLEMAVREKRTQPRSIMERVVPQLASLIGPNAEESPFYEPFKRMPDSIPAAERTRLQAEGKNGGRHGRDSRLHALRQFLSRASTCPPRARRMASGIRRTAMPSIARARSSTPRRS